MELSRWRSNTSTQGNQLLKVEGYDTFIEMWPLFLLGYAKLTDAHGANMHNLTVQEFFKTLLELAMYPQRGFLGVLVNKRSDYLGFVAAHNTTVAFRPEELTIFAIYSNGKCPSTSRELNYELRQWAKAQNFKLIKAQTYKNSGAGLRFFSHVLKMRHTAAMFQTEL